MSKSSSAKKGGKKGTSTNNLTSDKGIHEYQGIGPVVTDENVQAELKRLQDELAKERDERSFFQLERDKINEFWQITQRQYKDAKDQLLLKDRNIEELEERHQIELKVYKQKVKHLLYEYQNNISHIQTDAEKQMTGSYEEQEKEKESLKKNLRGLKVELKELELSHQEVVKSIKLKHDQEMTKLRADFDRRCKELYNKYGHCTKVLREELELRRKNEIHEVEERKNSQINALMKNHEKSFSEIKNYYNDITLNNLALINSLKEQVEEMKKKDERNERSMNEIMAENKRLKEPLDIALAEGELLKKQLKNYEKDKMALRNTKARLKVLEETHKTTQWEKDVMEQRFEKVEKERDELYEEFISRCKEIERRVGLKNLVLNRKLNSVKDTLDRKLNELITSITQATPPPQNLISSITARAGSIHDSQNHIIRDLQFEVTRIMKLHNDMLRKVEAKLVENHVPLDGLKFDPVEIRVGLMNKDWKDEDNLDLSDDKTISHVPQEVS